MSTSSGVIALINGQIASRQYIDYVLSHVKETLPTLEYDQLYSPEDVLGDQFNIEMHVDSDWERIAGCLFYSADLVVVPTDVPHDYLGKEKKYWFRRR